MKEGAVSPETYIISLFLVTLLCKLYSKMAPYFLEMPTVIY
jgi:hypothetical protein